MTNLVAPTYKTVSSNITAIVRTLVAQRRIDLMEHTLLDRYPLVGTVLVAACKLTSEFWFLVGFKGIGVLYGICQLCEEPGKFNGSITQRALFTLLDQLSKVNTGSISLRVAIRDQFYIGNQNIGIDGRTIGSQDLLLLNFMNHP